MMGEEASSKDLPLSANVQDIRVVHFVLDLCCHMTERVFDGSITLWCRPADNKTAQECQESTVEDLASLSAIEVGDCSKRHSSLVKSELSLKDMSSVKTHELSMPASDAGDNSETDVSLVKTGELCLVTSTQKNVGSCEDKRDIHERLCGHTQGTSQCTGGSSRIQCTHEDGINASEAYVQSSPAIPVYSGLPVSNANKLHSDHKAQKSAKRSPEVSFLRKSCSCDFAHSLLNAGDCDIACTVSSEMHATDCTLCDVGHTDSLERNAYSSNASTTTQCLYTCAQDTVSVTVDTGCIQCCENTAERGIANICETNHFQSVEVNTSETNHTGNISDYLESECGMSKTASAQEEIEDFSSDSSSLIFLHEHTSVLNPSIVSQPKPFRMVLDCHKLDIVEVEGIYLQGDEMVQFEEHPDEFVLQISEKDDDFLSKQHHCVMEFTMKEHCVHIYMEKVHSPQQFPHAVRICYKTLPSGPSLKWTKDQDDHPCVFTFGHFLSNRSLFPSQDFPTALLTWHAFITVSTGQIVLLTGDKDPVITVTDDGRKKFSFFTSFPMPTSTFAITVGSWKMETLVYESLDDDASNLGRPQLRLFFPVRLKEKSLSVLGGYLPRCMLEVQRMLGTYPFHRLDILVVPACFDSLGMASPSLLFLSQSVLCTDGSMCDRVAHELCHTWFGLVIGPQDWTEEWMTEGFCTYLEDILYARVTQLGDRSEDYFKLRAELNLRVLKAEIQNTDENLQSLRPNKGAGVQQPSSEEMTYLKNGMNVVKKFMQVHYLKGYFLLHALEKEVGRESFLSFLKAYVQRYMCQLVSSQDFLQMFFSSFPHLTDLSVESINRDWLDCPGMPERLTDTEDKEKLIIDKDNALSAQVNEQLTAVMSACQQPRRKRRCGKQPHHQQQEFPVLDELLTPQVILLLDRLLEEDVVPAHVLDLLKSSYSLHFDNAEVYHRWCELVVKHRHKKCYTDLQHFLINHQAMGVYLYGEASISRCPKILQLVRSCFKQLQNDMPEGVRDTVSSMLYGS